MTYKILLLLLFCSTIVIDFAQGQSDTTRTELKYDDIYIDLQLKLQSQETDITVLKKEFDNLNTNLKEQEEQLKNYFDSQLDFYLKAIGSGLGIAIFIVSLLGTQFIKKRIKEKIDDYVHRQIDSQIDRKITEDLLTDSIKKMGKPKIDGIIEELQKESSEYINRIKAEGISRISESSKEKHSEEVVELFRTAYSETNVETQIILYNKILSISPDFAEACNNLGVALLKKYEWKEALVNFNAAYKIEPNSQLALRNLANSHLLCNEIDLASQYIEESLIVNDQDPLTISTKGIILFYKREFNEALKLIDQAILLDPNNGTLYANRGFYFLQKPEGENDKAILDFNKSIELGVNTDQVYNNLAVAYRRKKNFDKSLELLEKAQQLNPYNPLIYGTLCLVHADKGNDILFYSYLEIALKKGAQVWNYLEDPSFAKYLNEEKFTSLIDNYKNS